jgi:hypothetical protein
MADSEKSPVVGSTLLETHVQFDDSTDPELVKLKFHEDGTVTYTRPFGRHRA